MTEQLGHIALHCLDSTELSAERVLHMYTHSSETITSLVLFLAMVSGHHVKKVAWLRCDFIRTEQYHLFETTHPLIAYHHIYVT